MTEAGWWEMNDKEAAGLRAYLKKGGFVIFDDFRSDFRGGGGWANFEANMRRVLPEGHFIPMDPTHGGVRLVLQDRIAGHHSAGLRSRTAGSSSACSRTTIRPSG